MTDFDSDNAGIKFNSDKTFIERANSGWCGTPPISYTNYDGTWNAINENTFEINVAYWGGTTNYKIEIVELNDTELKIKRIYK